MSADPAAASKGVAAVVILGDFDAVVLHTCYNTVVFREGMVVSK